MNTPFRTKLVYVVVEVSVVNPTWFLSISVLPPTRARLALLLGTVECRARPASAFMPVISIPRYQFTPTFIDRLWNPATNRALIVPHPDETYPDVI